MNLEKHSVSSLYKRSFCNYWICSS